MKTSEILLLVGAGIAAFFVLGKRKTAIGPSSSIPGGTSTTGTTAPYASISDWWSRVATPSPAQGSDTGAIVTAAGSGFKTLADSFTSLFRRDTTASPNPTVLLTPVSRPIAPTPDLSLNDLYNWSSWNGDYGMGAEAGGYSDNVDNSGAFIDQNTTVG